jgi:hypothetical protein
MSRLLKITLEYEDEIRTLEGEDVMKWLYATNANTDLAFVVNAYDDLKVTWVVKKK